MSRARAPAHAYCDPERAPKKTRTIVVPHRQKGLPGQDGLHAAKFAWRTRSISRRLHPVRAAYRSMGVLRTSTSRALPWPRRRSPRHREEERTGRGEDHLEGHRATSSTSSTRQRVGRQRAWRRRRSTAFDYSASRPGHGADARRGRDAETDLCVHHTRTSSSTSSSAPSSRRP